MVAPGDLATFSRKQQVARESPVPEGIERGSGERERVEGAKHVRNARAEYNKSRKVTNLPVMN